MFLKSSYVWGILSLNFLISEFLFKKVYLLVVLLLVTGEKESQLIVLKLKALALDWSLTRVVFGKLPCLNEESFPRHLI